MLTYSFILSLTYITQLRPCPEQKGVATAHPSPRISSTFFVESRHCQFLSEHEVRPLARQRWFTAVRTAFIRSLLLNTLTSTNKQTKIPLPPQVSKSSIIICDELSTARACARHRRIMITDFKHAAVPAVPSSGDLSPY